MRVLIPVDHAIGITGPHRNVVGSLNALTARDDTFVVLVTGRVDEDEPYARAKNIDIRLGFNPHRPQQVVTNLKLLAGAARGCDLIYVPTNLKSLLYAQTVRNRKPIVAGPNMTQLPFTKTNRHDSPGKIELRLLSNAWFEASQARRDHVRRISGVATVGYVHHAIDLDRFSPGRRQSAVWKKHGVPEQGVKVLFVGRDNETRKGVAQLLDAMDLILQSGREDIQLLIVGEMSAATKFRVASMPHVFLLGFQRGTALATLYASADLSVVPSSWENFPFTVLEAMASGIPVIGTRVGGIPEMIVDQETGLLVNLRLPGSTFKPEAPRLLADAILELSTDEAERCRFGSAARKRAELYFSEERLGRDLAHLFGLVVRGRQYV